MRKRALGDEVAAKDMLKAASGNVHLVGCCGVGMAGLAFHLAARGLRVSGCDESPGRMSAWLGQNGVPVVGGHDLSHLDEVNWVVRSTAAHVDIPELAAAADAGLPVLRRGVVLAALLQDYDSLIVSGTHGKTTTSAMIVQILRAGGLPPSFCIGGESESLGGVAGAGQSGVMVAEADESDGTLSSYRPDIAVITNIEFDHAEHFKNEDEMLSCFDGMARGTGRRLIYCYDDPGARRLCEGREKAFSYSLSTAADLTAVNHVADGSGSSFTVELHGRCLGEIRLPVPGSHNVLNALAACAAALAFKIPFDAVQRGLAEFHPVRRRFERIVDNEDILVVSDYAHHPSEIAALMSGAMLHARRRLLIVFQPHRFSRTLALGAAFPAAFTGADRVVLVPVYAASESPVAGGSIWDLYAHFRTVGRVKTLCAGSLRQAWAYMDSELRKGDGLLVVGAGDVVKVAGWAKSRFVRARSAAVDLLRRRECELNELGLRSTVIRTREPMAGKTTLHVGGQADIFLDVGCEGDLAAVLKWSRRRGVPVQVIGAGSNILVSDLGTRGVIIRLARTGFGSIRNAGTGCVAAGAAAGLNMLVRWLADHRKTGLLFLSGIPGTVGGALRMNAGAWGCSIGESTAWARVMERDGSSWIIKRSDMRFAYRECRTLRRRIVLDVGFRVEEGVAKDITEELESIAEKRAWMRGLCSAGSIFRNPGDDFAGRLIEQSGLKGLRVGGACVSNAHANWIVTGTGATASDVSALIGIVRDRVRLRCGVDLSKEIVCID